MCTVYVNLEGVSSYCVRISKCPRDPWQYICESSMNLDVLCESRNESSVWWYDDISKCLCDWCESRMIIRSYVNLVRYNDIMIWCESSLIIRYCANLEVTMRPMRISKCLVCANLVRPCESRARPLTTRRPCAKLSHAKITRNLRVYK
jgi:hypothetical protein